MLNPTPEHKQILSRVPHFKTTSSAINHYNFFRIDH